MGMLWDRVGLVDFRVLYTPPEGARTATISARESGQARDRTIIVAAVKFYGSRTIEVAVIFLLWFVPVKYLSASENTVLDRIRGSRRRLLPSPRDCPRIFR